MVHVEGSVPAAGTAVYGADTIYVHRAATRTRSTPTRALPWVPAVMVMDENQEYPSTDREQLLAFSAGGDVATVEIGRHAYAWRVPGVIAGVLMALFLYVLARLLFRRRSVAVLLGIVVAGRRHALRAEPDRHERRRTSASGSSPRTRSSPRSGSTPATAGGIGSPSPSGCP